MTQIIKHFPVMASNVLTKIASLNIKRPLRIADCNFGFGGHSRKILESFSNALVYKLEYGVKGLTSIPK
jgi:16S rRNA C1402 N4-methylase RsmH